MIYTSRYESPLGGILLAGDQEGLTGLWFTEGSRYVGQGLARDAVLRETEYFDQTKKWLDIYFSGRNPGFLPKIHLVGSDFRNRVGEIMCEIPYGKTVTYRWIARGRAQSDLYHCALSQGSWYKRKPDRIWRRNFKKESTP